MATDGGLRQLYRKHLPDIHWQGIETWSTGAGVPDVNFCHGGVEGWIENKLTAAWSVNLDPEQIGWIERRCRAGGRVFIAVRRRCKAGPRRAAADELYLFKGLHVRELALLGVGAIKTSRYAGYWGGGPARWDWGQVREALFKLSTS